MKSITIEGLGLSVKEDLGKNADGQDTGRSWSFVSLIDAAKQRAEFEAALTAAQRTKLSAAAEIEK